MSLGKETFQITSLSAATWLNSGVISPTSDIIEVWVNFKLRNRLAHCSEPQDLRNMIVETLFSMFEI